MRSKYPKILILVICRWYKWHDFFPPYFFEFSKYSTENIIIAFIIEQKGQFYYFQKPKLHCPFNVGTQPRPYSWTASGKGLGKALGTAAEACHIWKPSMRMTSPLEPIQRKPCLQELAEFFGQNLKGEEPRKNWLNEERTGLMAWRSPVYPSGLSQSPLISS